MLVFQTLQNNIQTSKSFKLSFLHCFPKQIQSILAFQTFISSWHIISPQIFVILFLAKNILQMMGIMGTEIVNTYKCYDRRKIWREYNILSPCYYN
jgi:hypothetical protein